MARGLTMKIIQSELTAARTAIAPREGKDDLKSGFAKTVRFYHNSRTRHNAVVFKLESGETVFRELKDNALDVMRAFAAADKVAVWYDKNKIVQQFVLSHDY